MESSDLAGVLGILIQAVSAMVLAWVAWQQSKGNERLSKVEAATNGNTKALVAATQLAGQAAGADAERAAQRLREAEQAIGAERARTAAEEKTTAPAASIVSGLEISSIVVPEQTLDVEHPDSKGPKTKDKA